MDTLPTQPTPQQRHSWKRRVFWAVLIFVLVVVLLGVLSLVIGFFVFKKNAEQQLAQSSQARSAQTAEVTRAPVVPVTTPKGVLRIETDDDPSLGAQDARVVIVEFSDFQCPFCRRSFPVVRELMALYGDRVRFIYRDYPVREIHREAQKAAEAGECAHEQEKFWALHDKIFQNQERIAVDDLKHYARAVGLDGARFDTCLDSGKYAQEVEDDYQTGVALGVAGTPTWFVNGEKIEGALPRELFQEVIELALSSTQ